MNCKICSSKTIFFSDAIIQNKYKIKYFKCINCGFVQTEEPYWLEEAYSDAINRSDIGLVHRNITLAAITKALIFSFFNTNAKFVDYGGGYGLFVRLMRDFGFDFYCYDKYCINLFAKDFEVKNDESNLYELLTTFEVFEHLLNPIEEIQKMLTFSKNILFTTVLFPTNTPKPSDWWYYGLDHGQHISLYTKESLSFIANKFSLNLYSNGNSLHLLTEKKISSYLFNNLSRYKIAVLLNSIFSRRTLIPADFEKITGKQIS